MNEERLCLTAFEFLDELAMRCAHELEVQHSPTRRLIGFCDRDHGAWVLLPEEEVRTLSAAAPGMVKMATRLRVSPEELRDWLQDRTALATLLAQVRR